MKILVLANKNVGRDCVRYLLREFGSDEYRFLIGPDNRDEIVSIVRDGGRSASDLTDAAVAEVTGSFPDGHFDWLLNLWGGQILRAPTLAKARHSLNIHPGFLPYGRGRDPIVWAIRRGEPCGLAFHQIIPAIDAGPLWYREEVARGAHETGGEVYARVIARCSAAFEEQWPGIRTREAPPVPQERPDLPTNRRVQTLADRLVTDERDLQVIRKLLAHDFGPSYRAQVQLDGRTFDVNLNLRPVDKSGR